MIELISVLLLIVGLGLMTILQKMILGHAGPPFLKLMNVIFFFFFWNSEYVASSILLFAILFYLKTEDKDSLTMILKNLVYVMLFAFIFRKLKDLGMQYILEQNLQN
jgi:hypothetical protein